MATSCSSARTFGYLAEFDRGLGDEPRLDEVFIRGTLAQRSDPADPSR